MAVGKWRVVVRSLCAIAVTSAMALTGLSSAQADPLDDRQVQIKKELRAKAHDIEDSSRKLSVAVQELDQSNKQLADAQQRLAVANSELDRAKAHDVEMARKLAIARKELAKAKQAVIEAKADLDAENVRVGSLVRDQMQRNTQLLSVSAFLTDLTTGDISQRSQFPRTVFDVRSARLDALTEAKFKLEQAEERVAAAEKTAAEQRKAAAAGLARSRELRNAANSAKNEVSQLVNLNQQKKTAAASALEQDKVEQAELEKEQTSVASRIKARNAKRERERLARIAAARKAAARKAKLEAQRKARQAAAAKRKGKSVHKSTKARKSSPRSHAKRTTASGFAYPVRGRITSPYGMRFHPILHRWKLHDGTDFGGGCGTPIRAVASGVVSERYYNRGYGNRLMIDHGRINGAYITSGYNHAIRYTVSPGQRVSKGQTIGYVGSTGYSTGCHLHFMIWRNGKVTNPMRVL